MPYADAQGNIEVGEVDIEWDVAALRSYFDECQKVYNEFLEMSDDLIKSFEAFANDETHKGPEADSAKHFIEERQKPLLMDITNDIQKLMDLQNNLMADFSETVDSSSTAKISTAQLRQIMLDFISYEDCLESNGKTIEAMAEMLKRTCWEVGTFTVPDYRNFYKELEKITSNDGLSGIVPELKQALHDFDEAHKDEISGSDYKTIFDTIKTNLDTFMAGFGNGKYYDISTYDATGGKLPWVTPRDVLTGEALEEYNQYCDDMEDYLQGKKPRCAVYRYDPVNMCNGNYINEHEDVSLGGRYILSFKRFYNAQSTKEGSLGLGWTHSFEKRIYEDETKKIRIDYPDGSKGSFFCINEKKHLYMEEHGEPGILEKLTDGYVITQDNGDYERFDVLGKLVAMGDNDGDNVSLSYEKSDSGKWLLSKVEAKNKNSLTFTYLKDENKGLIEKVTDQTGRSVSYAYEDKRLVSITEIDGATRKFTYDSKNRIKEVINPKGIVAITNEYDSKDRTTKQSFPDETTMTYEYDDEKMTTIATEQNGNQVVYTHDDMGRHTKTKYYDGEERYTYNKRNQKTSFTDKRGNTTRFSYDNKGHLTKIVDALGNKTSITYRADGKPMAVKGVKGEEYKYEYDLDGKLFEIRNPLNETNRFYYRDGNLEKTRNAAGALTWFSYDDRSNVNTIKDPDGVVTEYSYDDLNRVVATKNADGAITKYEYDNADRITRTIDALGNTREYTYDEMGKVTSVKEADGTTKNYDINIMGRVSKVVDEAGRVTEITYNAMGKQEKVLLPNGGVIKYDYDPLMRLMKVTDPEGRTTGYAYDRNGNVIEEYLGDVKVRSLDYDALNRVIKEVDVLGHEKTYAYDESGNLIEMTDTLGNKYTREYDLLGRVTKETDPLGNETSYTYSRLGEIETITDAAGRVRRFEYTNAGKLNVIYFCGKIEQLLKYDKVGRVEARVFADGYKISYSYDVLSRVSKVEGSDGRTVSYEYDAMGRATKVVDGRSTTLYTYTPTGRLKSVVDALGNETAYTYDALDNLQSVHRAEGRIVNTDSEYFPTVGKDGHVTLYSYNLSGQLTKVTDALGQEETYEYDQYGRLKTKTDRDNYATNYKYNNLGVVTEVGYADGRSVEFSYDALGKLNQFKDWLGTTSVERDVIGRALSVVDYKGRKVSYTYGNVSERTSITYPDGKKVDYIYDDNLCLSELVSGADKTSYIYDEFSRLTEKILPNANREVMSYLPGGYLRSLEMHDSNGLLDRYIYGYDTQGNRTEIERTRRELKDISGKYTYDYDLEKRLTNVRRDGELLRSYTYDAFGNRSIMTDEGVVTKYRYDELDRLLETVSDSKAISYEYDKRGNIAKEYTDGLLQKTFSFDATNMLSKVVDAEGKEASYSYNGMGKRVAVQNPTESIDYLLDLTKDYHNMLERTVNGKSETYTYDSNVVSMSKEGNDYFYMLDELGTGMYLTGTDGIATSTYAYDEFGRNINPFTGKKEKPAYTKQGNIIQPLAFTGYQHDEMTGNYFAQARYYDAGVGRFVSEDSVRGRINRPDTINHYLYCWNIPTSLRDLNGRDPIDDEFIGYQEHIEGSEGLYSDIIKPLYDSAKEELNSFTALFSTSKDAVYTGVDIKVSKEVSMPRFESIKANGKTMIKVFDSDYYSGGRGGIRYISENALMESESAVSSAFKASKSLSKIANVLVGVDGVVSFVDEYNEEPQKSTGERIINATVEATWSVGSAVGIGAIVGSIVPGPGTIVGAVAGFIVGGILSFCANTIINAKFFENGTESLMDIIKDLANGKNISDKVYQEYLKNSTCDY